MPTPVGHAIAGAIFYSGTSKSKKFDLWLLGTLLFFVVLPDIDFVFGFMVGDPNRYHHQFTHSFFFVILAGLIGGYLFAKWRQQSAVYSSAIFISAGITHVILDVLALDTSAPYGCPLFWPFSNQFMISPVVIFSDVSRASDTRTFFASLFNIHNLKTVLIEIGILAPIWGATVWWKRKRRVA